MNDVSAPPLQGIDVPGLVNLRDVGGLATSAGRRVRAGRLFRSATPHFLDVAGARRLLELTGVGVRVDLRSRTEVAEAPGPHLAAVERAVKHLPLRSGGPWVPDETLVDLPDRVAAHYLHYLQHASESITATVRTVASAEDAVLVHCTAGKDRTGVVVALLLSSVGVTPGAVAADYARTREELEGLWAQLRGLPAYEERLAALPEEALSAEPATMERFLARVDEEHGGAASYLARHGVTADELDALHASLVEPAR
jgi:protein-tyrosine phosphatase